VLIFPPDTYSFFPEETAIDFRAPSAVRQASSKRPCILGQLTERRETTIRAVRLLSNRDRRRLNLLD